MPRVSVCISVFNGAETLGAMLDSALAQSFLDREILVLDDGSTDGSGEIAEGKGVRVVRQENHGRGQALRRLVELAGGEWVALLDADDRWEPDKLERQMAFLEGKGVALVHCDGWFHYSDRTEARDLQISDKSDALQHLLPNNRIIASSAVFRKDAMLEAGNFSADTWAAVDWYGWFLLAARHRFAHQPERLVHYAIRQGSIANQKARFMAGKRHVLKDLVLPQFDELYGRLSIEQRQRFKALLKRELGVTTSAVAKYTPDRKEAKALYQEALGLAPTVPKVWLRALRSLAK